MAHRLDRATLPPIVPPPPPSPYLKLAIAAVFLTSPFLAFPDVLPAAHRAGIVTALVGLTFLLAATLARRWPSVRWGTWGFLLAVSLSWATMSSHDDVGIRHFGGIGLGMLLMAATAEWSRTSERLVQAVAVFALGAIVVVALGLAGTQVNPAKFVAGVELVPGTFYSWMPRLKLGLPGLDNGGFVNPNGLGGAALLVLPVCASLAVWAWTARRRLLLTLGIVATLLAILALTVMLSRTAVLATLLTAAVLGLWWKPGRRWVLLLVALAVLVVVIQSARSGAAAFEASRHVVMDSVEFRAATWRTALTALSRSPWLGLGINQFHEATPPQGGAGTSYVAHAHNIFIQVALDIGVFGLAAYLWLVGTLIGIAARVARRSGISAIVAGGAGLSMVGVHLFGLGDAIALGAKVGAFQWLSAGLILGASAVWDLNRGDRTDS